MEIQEIINQIFSGNSEFTNSHNKEYFDAISGGQHPYITLITCCDSRVPVNAVLPDSVNRIFTIQNIGNQILSSEGSVDYGIYHLKTPLLLILGHSDCGAVKAYLKGYNNEPESIKSNLNLLKPVLEEKSNNGEKLCNCIGSNVDYQVSVAYNKYHNLINEGKLTIIGAYYDFKGDFKVKPGSIVITNVNNNKNIEEIKKMNCFRNLDPKIISSRFNRL